MSWAYRSPCYRALSLLFGVRSEDPEVGAYLDHVLSGLLDRQDEQEVWYSIVHSVKKPDRPYALFFDRELVTLAHSKAFAIQTLLWHLNGETVRNAESFVVLHAGGVALDGRAAIISGPSGIRQDHAYGCPRAGWIPVSYS
jgi:hypothetical protein